MRKSIRWWAGWLCYNLTRFGSRGWWHRGRLRYAVAGIGMTWFYERVGEFCERVGESSSRDDIDGHDDPELLRWADDGGPP